MKHFKFHSDCRGIISIGLLSMFFFIMLMAFHGQTHELEKAPVSPNVVSVQQASVSSTSTSSYQHIPAVQILTAILTEALLLNASVLQPYEAGPESSDIFFEGTHCVILSPRAPPYAA